MKRNNLNILIAAFLVAMTVLARVINAEAHIPNVVPIAAISIFCGAIMKDNRALAFLVPLLGQFLADVYFQFFTDVRGFYDLAGMAFNYGALVCATAIGTTMKQPKPLAAAGYVLGGSLTFFLVSNFGYFAHGWNGYTVSGLVKTYVDAIPFSKFTIAGDIVGGALLFGSYFMLQARLEGSARKVEA